MKISDLPDDNCSLKIGTRIMALNNSDLHGTVIWIDSSDDYTAWVVWDDQTLPSGFYGTRCNCEIIDSKYPDDISQKVHKFFEKRTVPPETQSWLNSLICVSTNC